MKISHTLKFLIFPVTLVFSSAQAAIEKDVSNAWQTYKSVKSANWSDSDLQTAEKRFDELGSAAFMVVEKEVVVAAWGDVSQPLKTYSVRKSLMSLMYGKAIESGDIQLSQNLARLNINESSPLLDIERNATIAQLLNSTSGIYHPAAKVPPGLSNIPARGEHQPGHYWWYNNWGFNAALTVYEQQTGKQLAKAFMQQLAEPLALQDLTLNHIQYVYEPNKSIHPAYEFHMSARDLARIGMLVLNQGKWAGKQLVPSAWIEESTSNQWTFEKESGYGYMWWVNPGSSDMFNPNGKKSLLSRHQHIAALGNYGQMLLVVPQLDLVIVHRGYRRDKGVNDRQVFELVDMVLAAKKGAAPEGLPVQTLKFDTHKSTQNDMFSNGMDAPTATEIEELIGDYVFRNKAKISLYRWNGMLFTSGLRPEHSHLQLWKKTNGAFSSYEMPLQIRFERLKHGDVTGLKLTFSGRTMQGEKVN